MSDYSWAHGDEIEGRRIAPDELPLRFALTAPQVIINNGGEVLLVDPHPSGKWLSWMFPYASLILQTEDILDRQRIKIDPFQYGSLNDLACFLDECVRSFRLDYLAAIKAEVNNVIPGISDGWEGESFYVNYSLKFSMTSNSYTAYRFEYFKSNVAPSSLTLPHIWVPIRQAESFLSDPRNLAGYTVSSNVTDLIARLQ